MAASIYVVGGAAIAVTVYDARRTLDIDALVSDHAVLEEARLLAESEGIPPTWLNQDAKPWVPPRPADATVVPKRPGLTVHWAPAEHLLAMKLVAMRPQDTPDIVALAHQIGLGTDASAYADLLERVYSGEGVLQQASADNSKPSLGRFRVGSRHYGVSIQVGRHLPPKGDHEFSC